MACRQAQCAGMQQQAASIWCWRIPAGADADEQVGRVQGDEQARLPRAEGAVPEQLQRHRACDEVCCHIPDLLGIRGLSAQCSACFLFHRSKAGITGTLWAYIST